MTSQALERLPRGQTIEALLAFNSMKYVSLSFPFPVASPAFFLLSNRRGYRFTMLIPSCRDRLKAFLEPFRDGGRVVSAGDIEEFMQGIKESRGR